MNTPQLRLDIRQAQQLVMTPALQQAISLLQLNNQELAALLQEEVEQNPLLDLAGPEEAREIAAKEKAVEREGASLSGELTLPTATAESEQATSDYESGISDWSEVSASGSFDDLPADDPFRNTEERETLRDHLITQIQMDFTGPDRAAATLLCDYLDEAGYLRADLIEIADMLQMPPEDMLLLVGRLQQLDPPGIFARNLAECLELQLSDRNALSPEMAKLLANLDMLATHDYEKLQKKCGITREQLDELIAQIRSCDPKPAAAFDHAPPATLIPDILMRAVKDPESGLPDWELELNAETLPRALVKEKYFTRVMGDARDDKSKKFLQERHQAAHWLVRALQSRAETILKVSRAIVKFQDAFFHKGITELKPLTLKDIASDVAMHESTISRVTSGKYMATPRGTFELKYFFNAALSSAHGGADYASEAVRVRIKQLVSDEKPDDILSDDRLVLMLQSEGVDVARRTVAKYREAMGIPGSFHRKRLAR